MQERRRRSCEGWRREINDARVHGMYSIQCSAEGNILSKEQINHRGISSLKLSKIAVYGTYEQAFPSLRIPGPHNQSSLKSLAYPTAKEECRKNMRPTDRQTDLEQLSEKRISDPPDLSPRLRVTRVRSDRPPGVDHGARRQPRQEQGLPRIGGAAAVPLETILGVTGGAKRYMGGSVQRSREGDE